jgi:hypothetical protein
MKKEENFVTIVQGNVLIEIHLVIHFLLFLPLGNQQWSDILNDEFSKVVI